MSVTTLADEAPDFEAPDAAQGAGRAEDGWVRLWRSQGPANARSARPIDGAVQSWASLDHEWVYRYVEGSEPSGVSGASKATGAIGAIGAPAIEQGAVLTLLEPMLEIAGASAGQVARWHYVVETDVEPSAQADFDAWYTQEHMPGLAAVPGVARARRFRAWIPAHTEGDGAAGLSTPASPRWIAAYDLVEREAFNSPPWRAVRATPWSSRVRPAFRRTRRTMFAITD